MYCFCHRLDDGRLMVQCNQCDGWFHGVCRGYHPRGVRPSSIQYICPSCMGDGSRIRCLFFSYSDSSDDEEAPAGGRTSARDRDTPRREPDTADHRAVARVSSGAPYPDVDVEPPPRTPWKENCTRPCCSIGGCRHTWWVTSTRTPGEVSWVVAGAPGQW